MYFLTLYIGAIMNLMLKKVLKGLLTGMLLIGLTSTVQAQGNPIAANSEAIGINASDIATNAENISIIDENTSIIDENTSINAENIETNTSDISSLEGRIDELDQGNSLSVKFFIRRSTTGGLPNDVPFLMQWGSPDYDIGNSISGNRFIPTSPGTYFISTNIRLVWAGNHGANHTFQIFIRRNGGELARAEIGNPGCCVAATVSVLAEANGTSDYFEVWAYHNSGGGARIEGSSSKFMAFQVH